MLTSIIRLSLALFVTGLISPAIAAEPAPKFEPNSASEPKAATVSLNKTADFLDNVALDWTRKRKCGTCHTNYAYLMARPTLPAPDSPAAKEIRSFFENRVAHWDDAEKVSKPRFDAEVIATASALAFNDSASTGKLQPATRKALDRIWTLQRKDGAFEWLKCGWPPLEHDDAFGAVFVAVAVGHAPDDYAKTPKAIEGMERLRGYLKANPVSELHHKVFLLWASLKDERLLSETARKELTASLLSLQQADGGWSLPSLGNYTRHDKTPNLKDAPSDGYATGLVVYVLQQAKPADSKPAIERGLAWLRSNQRASGRWFTRSVSTDGPHYITHAGTAFAALALKAAE